MIHRKAAKKAGEFSSVPVCENPDIRHHRPVAWAETHNAIAIKPECYVWHGSCGVIGIELRQVSKQRQEKAMDNKPMAWDEDALKWLEKIPVFVRSMAKVKIEKAAMEAGESRVTSAFMDANKERLKG